MSYNYFNGLQNIVILAIDIINSINKDNSQNVSPGLYSFTNRPNDIGVYKKNALYQSSIRHISTSVNSDNLNLINSITPLPNISLEDNSQNEFQCKDYIPSKKRKNLTKPLSFPPNLMKQMVILKNQWNVRI